ncbi:MAG: decaprenyl-phosphate phosphoribosyltransferase [Anaerolineales bacterium]|nr:decaprenyl-phosphate phosphoribosyltransferase [Anaerolineales bacterium]
MLPALLESMRPKQWLKNGAVFAALVFDGQLLQAAPFLRTLAGFVLLCLLSSAVYLINDLADIDKDRQHPKKRLRPLPSGRLKKAPALAAAFVLPLAALPLSAALDWRFGVIALIYLVNNLAYSFWLKHVVLIDVLLVASGYVLRVGAGVVLIVVERFSPWLYLVITLGALFMGFGKRRGEMVLQNSNSGASRRVLEDYTLPFLDELINIVATATIMAYSLYTFSAPNLPENHTMMLTIPFVIYGIFRYLYLIHVKGEGGAPDELVLVDRPLQAAFLLWGLLAVAVLYLSP